MHSFEDHKGEIHTFPSCISECTEDQYLAFAKANVKWQSGLMLFEKLKVDLLYSFLNMKRKVNNQKTDTQTQTAIEQVYHLSQNVNSFYIDKKEKGKTFKIIKLDFINNPIPEFTHNGIKYYGPTTALQSLKYGQYLEANNAYQDYAEHQEEKYLDILIATLYTLENRVFNPKSLDFQIKNLSSIDISVKYGVFLFFGSCIKWISNQNKLPLAGGATADLSALFIKNDAAKENKGIGMLATLYDLSETGVFGNLESTAKQSLYDVLVYLAHKTSEAKKLKQNVKNRRT